MNNPTLWYDEPAGYWEAALPIGNGTMGAMIFAHPGKAVFQLNEESVWYGKERGRINPSSRELLPRIRALLFDGSLEEAEQLAFDGMFAVPFSQGHYEPLGNLCIDFGTKVPHHSTLGGPLPVDWTGYRRSLDLSQGLHRTVYDRSGRHYEWETFLSFGDQVMAHHIRCSGQMEPLRLSLERGDHYERGQAGAGTLLMQGRSGGDGPAFACMLQVETDGMTTAIGEHLIIEEASEVTVYLTAVTSFKKESPASWCETQLTRALQKGYEVVKQEHIRQHSALFGRVDLSLDLSDTASGCIGLPTDRRLERLKAGAADDDLYALYFQYGRYLLLSCSRPGSLPANLQGVWNQEMTPPWGSKYTININTQMNYWPAETTNLGECHLPLFDHLKRMLPRGQQVAREMYGCRGFVAHHNTDIYGDCAPQDQWMPATIWPMGGAWLALHIMEHYRFSLDRAFLEKYQDIMLEAALFYLDYLVKSPSGQWVTSPSTSPENTYMLENGQMSALCYGPTMDSQLIRQLFGDVLELCRLLELELPWRSDMEMKLDGLPPTCIGGDGRILEWSEPYAEWEPGHRHISHLYGLYPGYEIDSRSGRLFEAARNTLEGRLAHGGGHTGWSRAWIINLWARLQDGEKALENVRALLTHSTETNLFDMHPPFQIDGNFGGTAGIAEMLLQSKIQYQAIQNQPSDSRPQGVDNRNRPGDEQGSMGQQVHIHLLPALPMSWSQGSFRGLKARGNIEVSAEWQDGQVSHVTLSSPLTQRVRMTANGSTRDIHLEGGNTTVLEL